MPTGYTAGVQDGTIKDFRTFALTCARAFGALVLMRDDPMDAPIEEFKPSTYHLKSFEEAKQRAHKYSDISDEEAEGELNKENQEVRKRNKQYQKEVDEQLIRYASMLKEVEEWEPPTFEHIEMKNFMIQQLKDSIEHDCVRVYQIPIDKKSPWQWARDKKDEALRDIGYHLIEHEKEIKRTNDRNEWVKQLRESIGDTFLNRLEGR